MGRYTAACIRALRTAIQTLVGGLVASETIYQVDWSYLAGATAIATLVSLGMGMLRALPEVDESWPVIPMGDRADHPDQPDDALLDLRED